MILNLLLASALALSLAPAIRASATQRQPADKIFAAICSTCHGADGNGGASWIDGASAMRIAGIRNAAWVTYAVRHGFGRLMPGFGADQITDEELQDLVAFLASHRGGVPRPAPPAGAEIVLNILDADPWYRDDGTDSWPDTRRVALGPGQYLKVVNTGRTWHTITADELGKDSGFIGYSQFPDTGYYYADPATDLAPGCVTYHCHLHPYMQTEVCTPGATPRPLSSVSKDPLPVPPLPGIGEIWVSAQTQNEDDSDAVDGAMQVLDAASWAVSAYIPNVGNNPHSSGAGTDAGGRPIVIVMSWHDNLISVVDAARKELLVEAPSGAASAHVQSSPRDPKLWVATQHGGVNGVEKIDTGALETGGDFISGVFDASQSGAQSGTHGIWFCDDGKHFITANSFSDTVSLYSLDSNAQLGWASSAGKFTLNPSVMAGDPNGCKRAYATNAESHSVSVFDIDVGLGRISRRVLSGELADANGNLALSDTGAQPVRWARTPIQAPISPPGSTTHRRYMVISNKSSLNVTAVRLDDEGVPAAIYTFPSGLGAHGAAFGRKQTCDTGNPADVCYYAYVANTFEDYVGVYDLEKIENGGMGDPGTATETVHLGGALADLLIRAHPSLLYPHARVSDAPCAKDAAGDLGCAARVLPAARRERFRRAVPITVFCPDCRSGVHAGDVPLRLTTRGHTAYLETDLWIDETVLGGTRKGPVQTGLEVRTDTGGFGIAVWPGTAPW